LGFWPYGVYYESMTNKILLAFFALLLGAGGYYFFGTKNVQTVTPSIRPTPVQLLVNPTEKEQRVILETPVEGQVITSPLKITGKARGNWFFEASFPVVLTDWDGKIIAQTIATAQGEWMTTDYVPFTAEVEFEKPAYGERGTLILQKDNPSGLSENDAAYEIAVKF